MFLLGETLTARAGKESAEAVVVMTLVERREERRAEESRKELSLDLDRQGEKATETMRSSNNGGYRIGEEARGGWIPAGAAPWLTSPASLRTKTQEESQ